MKSAKYILRLTVTLLLITAIVAGLLGLVNYLAEDKIATLQNEKAESAMREVLEADSYEPLETDLEGVTALYQAGDRGYVVRVSVNGFGGAIDMMVGVDTSCTVTGVSIISHSETASLGANCTREDFRAQFVGAAGDLSVKKDGGSIDALTGATVTSRAVTKGVNLALACVKEVLG
ncbi:MAG: RnfABCDGE type electron transport complex subunit G [Faecousia sp.]